MLIKGKEVIRIAKLQFNAGQAKPGPALAGLGIAMPEFTKKFNDLTKDRGGEPVPVKIYVYKDKSFSFEVFKAPVTHLLKKISGIESGAKNSKTERIAEISQEQLEQVAREKIADLNTDDIQMAMHIVAGSAKNMGIKIKGWDEVLEEKNKKLKNSRSNAIKNLKARRG